MNKIIKQLYYILKYIIRQNKSNIIVITFDDKEINTGYYLDKSIADDIINDTCTDISNIVKFDLVFTKQQQMQEYKELQRIKYN